MKLLLDTNAVFPIEPLREETVGDLEGVAARLHSAALHDGHALFVHPASLADLQRDPDLTRRRRRQFGMSKYPSLSDLPAPDPAFVAVVGAAPDGSNDWVDNQLLFAVFLDAVDLLVSDDRGIHSKARRLGIGERVITLAQAELVLSAEQRRIAPPPAVEAVPAYALDPADAIFSSFRADYPGFDLWFAGVRREHRPAWRVMSPHGTLAAIAIVKPEDTPPLHLEGRSMKLCSFKVADHSRGLRLGELLLRTTFEYARDRRCDNIFVSVYDRHLELTDLFEIFGFERTSFLLPAGDRIWTKRLTPPAETAELDALSFAVKFGPGLFRASDVPWYLVPIQPRWCETLFPGTSTQGHLLDGVWAHGNAIRKAYLCNSRIREPAPGSVLAFYRSGTDAALVSLGVVEDSLRAEQAEDIARFVSARSVYTFEQMRQLASSPVLSIRFRAERLAVPAVPRAMLALAGVFRHPPQSIYRLTPDSTECLRTLIRT